MTDSAHKATNEEASSSIKFRTFVCDQACNLPKVERAIMKRIAKDRLGEDNHE